MYENKLHCIFAIILLLVPNVVFATGVMQDFENGSIEKPSPDTNYMRKWDFGPEEPGNPELSISTPGLLGSNYCMRSHVAEPNDDPEDGNYSYHTWHEASRQGIRIYEAAGANRFSFYALFPSNLSPIESSGSGDNNFHIGTYTADVVSYVNGLHYYHYYRLYGSQYPLHLVANEHPQNLAGVNAETQNNPEEWNYLEGWTRIYLQLVQTGQPDEEFSIFYDNLEFYTITEPENDETVNSIWVGYMGSDAWRMGFALNCQHTNVCDAKNHNYEVRYSTSPITNANYSSATSVGTFVFDVRTYNQVPVSFSIPNSDDSGTTHYYFAVDDLDDNSTHVTKIDYVFATTHDPNPTPKAPENLSITE